MAIRETHTTEMSVTQSHTNTHPFKIDAQKGKRSTTQKKRVKYMVEKEKRGKKRWNISCEKESLV